MKMWLFLLVIAQLLYRTKFDTFLNNVDDWNKNDWYSLEWCTTVLLIQSFDSWGSFSDLKCWHFLYYTIELLISWVAGGSLNPTVGLFFIRPWNGLASHSEKMAVLIDSSCSQDGLFPPSTPLPTSPSLGWKEEQDELQHKLRPCNILYLISMCYESYQIFIGMLGDLFLALCNTWQLPLPLSLSHPNPLHLNISIHILHTVLCTLTNVLIRRIWLTIKSFFS